MADFCWLPILLGVVLPVSIACTFTISLHFGHVATRDYPYISDTGNFPPESCFFGQFLNMCAIMMGVFVYVRHKYLTGMDQSKHPPSWLSKTVLWTGWVSSFGVSVVGNFQIHALESVHMTGAALAFGVGVVYLWFQVLLTLRYDRRRTCLKIGVRIILATLATIFLITVATCQVWRRHLAATGGSPKSQQQLFRLGSIAEWGLAFFVAVFFLSFPRDFWHISITSISKDQKAEDKWLRSWLPKHTHLTNDQVRLLLDTNNKSRITGSII